MENNQKILEELRAISPSLMQLQDKNPYSVSLSYFATLPDSIVEKLAVHTEPSFSWTKETPYSAPEGYFQNLSILINERVNEDKFRNEVWEEMETIAPFLNTISKRIIYTVPPGYLEDLQVNKLEIATKPAKVISLTNGRKVLQYATAAVVTGLLAVGGILFTGKQHTTVQANSEQASSQVKTLSEQEIVDFLKTTAPADNTASTGGANIKDKEIKNSVSQMSDNEIQQFLLENGGQDEM